MSVASPRRNSGRLTWRTHRTTDHARTQHSPIERETGSHNGVARGTHGQTVRPREMSHAPFDSGGATAKPTDAPKAGYKQANGLSARVWPTCDRPTLTMYEIVIPIPTDVSNRLTDRVKGRMAEHFGGFTVQEASGGWVSPNGETVTEPVEVLTTVASESDVNPEAFGRATARHVASESDETEVMWFVRQVAAGGFESGD